jgi:histidine kinase-like protein
LANVWSAEALPLQGREGNLHDRSDQGQGFDSSAIPDPLSVDNLEAEHERGIHLMKLVMDEVSFERRGAEVHMFKGPANDVRAS